MTTDEMQLLKDFRSAIPELDEDEVRRAYAYATSAPRQFRGPAWVARRRRGHRRLVLAAVAGGLALLAAAAVATATGVMPWITRAQEFRSAPFVTTPRPETLPGSNVVLTMPGPESTTFEIVTNNTVTIGGKVNSCVAIINKDSQGQRQGAGLTGCGSAGAALSGAGSFGWQAPSGTKYAVVEGTTDAATVALRDPNGATLATGKVEGGYFLIYTLATATLPTDGSLVFSDASGHVVDTQPLDLSPQRPCTSAASPAPCGKRHETSVGSRHGTLAPGSRRA